MEKSDKIITIIGIVFTILLIVGAIGWFTAATIHGANQPEHLVKIEYVIYRGNTPYPKTGIYKMKGKSFHTTYYTRSQRYGNGPNILEIKDSDDWGLYVGKQSICVYNGYNDVEVKSLKVIQ